MFHREGNVLIYSQQGGGKDETQNRTLAASAKALPRPCEPVLPDLATSQNFTATKNMSA